MDKPRFRLDRAKTNFDCYDCRKELFNGNEFAWDNLRNCKVCLDCLDKLSDSKEQEKEAARAAEQVFKTDSERIAALEERINDIDGHILHLKSLWYNEMRTLARHSHEAATRRLTPLKTPEQNRPVSGFTMPSELFKDTQEKLNEHQATLVRENTVVTVLDNEDIPF